MSEPNSKQTPMPGSWESWRLDPDVQAYRRRSERSKRRRGRPNVIGRERDGLAILTALRGFVTHRQAVLAVCTMFDIDERNLKATDRGAWLPTALPEDIARAIKEFDAGFARPVNAANPVEDYQLQAGRHVLVNALFALEANLARIRANLKGERLGSFTTDWPAPLRNALLQRTRRPPVPVFTESMVEAAEARAERNLGKQAKVARRAEYDRARNLAAKATKSASHKNMH